MTTLSTGSIHNIAFNTIFNLVNTNKVIASGVFSQFPDRNPVYPLHVIQLSLGDGQKSFGNVSRSQRISFIISSFSQSGRQLDEISDELEQTISQNQSAVAKSGLASMLYSTEFPTQESINSKKIHIRDSTVLFDWWGVV